MSYVRKVLSRDERLLSISRLHWIYVVEGVFIFALFVSLGIVADHYLEFYTGLKSIPIDINLKWFHIREISNPFKWIMTAAGFAMFLPLFLVYLSTEVGLTDKRIIYKKGLMFIEVQQLDLEDIRAENVTHGWFGWLFRYGKLHFDCRFVDDLYIPAINKPYRLVKAAHVARMKHPGINYKEDQLARDIEDIDHQRQKAREKLSKFGNVVRGNFKSNNSGK